MTRLIPAIAVKVIRSKGQASLVEWEKLGKLKRALIPREAITEDHGKFLVAFDDLEMGIPYGVNWESRLREEFVVTGAKIAEQLEVSGIWTKEDYISNPGIVQQAVLAAAKEILAELRVIVHNIPK